MSELSYFTKEGFDNLKSELHDFKTRQRQDVANQIAEAREKGDLSENAEYDAAKEAQSLLELKISKLEKLLMNARVLDDSAVDTSKAFILSFVKVKDGTGKISTYQLVSAKEANLAEHRISVDSPIGRGLLGKSVGDTVEVNVPKGKLTFELLEISR